jgi:molecular chaperone HscA
MVGGLNPHAANPAAVGAVLRPGAAEQPQPGRSGGTGCCHPGQPAGRQQPGRRLLLLDVIPLSLGMETMGGLVERIVARNETIPCAMAQDFTTYMDGQTALALHVVQGERDLVATAAVWRALTLRGIPPMAAGAARIRVTFTIDADGLLKCVSARADQRCRGAYCRQTVLRLADDANRAACCKTALHRRDRHACARRGRGACRCRPHAAGHPGRAGSRWQTCSTPTSAPRSSMQVRQLRSARDVTDAARNSKRATQAWPKRPNPLPPMRMNRGIQRALSGKNIESI